MTLCRLCHFYLVLSLEASIWLAGGGGGGGGGKHMVGGGGGGGGEEHSVFF